MDLNSTDRDIEGFHKAAPAYERGRPSYPEGVIEFLHEELTLLPGAVVLDLGAGTGKLTRQLDGAGFKVVACDRAIEMLAVIKATGSVPTVCGTAESIPLRSDIFAAVVIGQAFQWFQPNEAIAEIHRVLRSQGVMVLVWNGRDHSIAWVKEIEQIVGSYRRDAPQWAKTEWIKTIDRIAILGPTRHHSLSWIRVATIDQIIASTGSRSYIASLPEYLRFKVLKEVEASLRSSASLSENDTLELPFVTDIYWCSKMTM
jgi:SAM-dependent methyltransferase